LTCLFTLQGIPCVYYGTEQGLSGRGDRREAVREVLWAQPQAFSTAHPLYGCIQTLGKLRKAQPALRFGRMYMRPVSGNAVDFGYSEFAGGVLAWSRILDDREVVVVANTSPSMPFSGYVNVDASLSPSGKNFALLYSNRNSPAPPAPVRRCGDRMAVPVQLQPIEAQVLG
jgi:glycosidase